MFATARKLQMVRPRLEIQKHSIFLRDSKLTPAGVILCLAMVTLTIFSSAVIMAFYAGEQTAENRGISQAMDRLVVRAGQLTAMVSSTQDELDALHRPQLHTGTPPDSIHGVGGR